MPESASLITGESKAGAWRNYERVIRWSEEDEAFLATCPSFANLSAFGPSPEDALREASVALELFIAEYEADGVALPPPHTAEHA